MRTMLIAVLLALPLTAAAQTAPIPAGSTIYIEPADGFETYLMAAFREKKVPLTIVTDSTKAEYVLRSVTEHGDKPGFARAWILGQHKRTEDASITVINTRTSAVHFAYSAHKYNAKRGQQSAAEACAKHLASYVRKGK